MHTTILRAYSNASSPPDIRPAFAQRGWMDDSPDSYAYRCLPLNIANAHGWELRSRAGFTATWDGGAEPESVVLQSDDPPALLPSRHFGGGIITFDVQLVFRTSPRWNLWITGPINAPRDGIAPLSAVVETDWLPYTFTMNWQFTRPNHTVRFERGDPFCHFFPVPRGYLEDIRPELMNIDDDPALKQQLLEWGRSRDEFQQALSRCPSNDPAAQWQKRYYRGLDLSGMPAIPDHCTRLRLHPFAARGSQGVESAEAG